MKRDEKELLEILQAQTTDAEFPHVRSVAIELKMHEKRAAYICEKWYRAGWYSYGVNVLAGWLTAKGMRLLNVAQKLENENE